MRGLAFVPSSVPSPASSKAIAARIAAVLGGFAAPAPKPFTVVSADYHGKLIWWQGDAAEPKSLRAVAAHDGWCRAVAVSPDGRTVATCGNDHLVKLWKAADGTAVRTLTGHESHVYNVAFHPDGTRLVSCDLKGVVKDWDLKTGKCERDIYAKVLGKYDTGFMADIGGARGMAFQPDGSAVAVCGITNVSNAFAGVGNPAVVVIDWKDGKSKVFKPKDAYQGTAWGVAFQPSGAVIAAGGGQGGRIWFWKPDDLVSVHTVTVPANGRDLALSPSGDRLAVAGSNGSAYVYDFSGPGVTALLPPKK